MYVAHARYLLIGNVLVWSITMLHVELDRQLSSSWITLQTISCSCFHRSVDISKTIFHNFFITTKDIFSFSFNSNALEKCTCGKALEVTFVSEDDVDSEQILSLSESASKRKIQLNNDKSSLDEGIEDDSGACRRIQTCLNGQSS